MSRVLAQLRKVEDPELPVSIVDLGMVRGVDEDANGTITVTLVPTFLGCPAQLFIERDIADALPGAQVRWSAEPWGLADVTDRGREALAELGVVVPDEEGAAGCPFCGSPEVDITGEFGATLCRRLAFCRSCRSPIEVMRGPEPMPVILRRARAAR